MTDTDTNTLAKFCPQCGTDIAASRTIAVDDDLPMIGVWGNGEGCIAVETGEVRLYVHVDGDAS
ncbi:hypothetical protein ACFPYI_01700 [Halomarina salina]|uniref:Uncharacterized protein n=1 Tax=Halomarina salina TaxID=1872699 RepID=A0ABD5RI95_9EURY|nr:hypothetical protein [Halomarina salina]